MPRKTPQRLKPKPRDFAGASMRPRPDAAENPGRASPPLGRDLRFNEAAARCRGKPRAVAEAQKGAPDWLQ